MSAVELIVLATIGLCVGAYVVRRQQRRDAALIAALRAIGPSEWDAIMAATDPAADWDEYDFAALDLCEHLENEWRRG